eukprot:1555954-Heterocapsa_arctica.AAC.1
MIDPDFDIKQSTAVAKFAEMKQDPQYKDWTVQQKLDKLSSWMSSMAVGEKKALSAMGAMR